MSGRDDDTTARGFPAFAARKGGRARGQSWWGKAWTEAMEDTSLDEEPLKKGRAFARSGHLGPITVSPGRIFTQAYDGADGPYETAVTLAELSDEEWDLLWEKTADRPGELEALLAGELPPDLLEAAEDARVRLLPGYGDLEPDCDCDAFDHPCKHAAALCYQASWLLDEDPHLLFLMRGRSTEAALEELKATVLMRAMEGEDEEEHEDRDEETGADAAAEDSEQSSGQSPSEKEPGQAAPADAVPAADAYAASPLPLPELPELPAPPVQPDEPLTGIEADPLDRLVADAALRARELLAYTLGRTAAPAPPLDAWRDTVRIAATHPDPRAVDRLRQSCPDPALLDRAAAAWRLAGAAGLAVLEEPWTPPQQELARARTSLGAAWAEDELPDIEAEENRWTLVGRGLQLRYGRDARWYPYREDAGEWWPAAAPHADAADALAELLGA
ncbi:SWIM zinc finger family protein [Streptomyces sp. NPDC002851]